MKIDLTDQVALVTGSAHRVGKGIALELARQGVNLLVHYHNTPEEIVRDTIHEIKSFGVDAFAVQADISQPEGVQELMEFVDGNYGKLNILVNSASAFQRRTLMEVTPDDWELTMAVNLRAPFLLTQAVVPIMRENTTGGVIVNILDRGADGPWKEFAHHGISKAALWALTEVSAVSLGPEIRVNGIVPGPILKPADGMNDEDWEKIGATNPLNSTGDPSDVGRAVVYLASESFLTGVKLHVSAGEHLQR